MERVTRSWRGRVGGAALVAVLLAAGLAGATPRKGGKAAKAPPVSVTLENGCQGELDLTLGEAEVKVLPGATFGPLELVSGAAQVLRLRNENPVDLARLTFATPGVHVVKVADCRKGAADVYTRWDGGAGSPHATAQVRFRARSLGHLEYQAGATGAFKPLSVAFTSFQEVPGGELTLTLRQRAAKAGPVVGTVKRTVKLEPGHKHVIEVDMQTGDAFVIVEDEGPTG